MFTMRVNEAKEKALEMFREKAFGDKSAAGYK